jgi:hypothetical protein
LSSEQNSKRLEIIKKAQFTGLFFCSIIAYV